MTRLRSALTISALCVAITSVVPRSFTRRRSLMISQLVTGSRLPVGSSAMRMRGPFTSARGADQKAEIARLDAQVDVAEGLGAVGVVLAHRVKRDQLRRPSLARFRPNHNRVLAQNTTSVRSK